MAQNKTDIQQKIFDYISNYDPELYFPSRSSLIIMLFCIFELTTPISCKLWTKLNVCFMDPRNKKSIYESTLLVLKSFGNLKRLAFFNKNPPDHEIVKRIPTQKLFLFLSTIIILGPCWEFEIMGAKILYHSLFLFESL